MGANACQNSLRHFLVHVTSKWAFLVLGGCKCLTGWLVHFLAQLGNVKKNKHGMACHGPSSAKFILLNEKITTFLSSKVLLAFGCPKEARMFDSNTEESK